MNVKTWIPLILAVALGLVAMAVARRALRPGGASAGPVNSVPVVVAKRDVAVGRELAAEDLAVNRMPLDAAPTRAFQNVQDLVGRAVTTPIVKGQAVIDTLLAPAGSGAGIQAVVPPGMRAITIEVNEVTGLGGMLVPGARVDVICSIRDEKTQQPAARTILQNIRVLALGRQMSAPPQEAGQPAPPPSNNVTLLVNQKQAQALQLASQGSRPWLVLRSPRDSEESQATATSMAELRGEAESAVSATAQLIQALFARRPRGDGEGPATQPATAEATDPVFGPSAKSATPRGRTRTVQVINGGVVSQIEVPLAPEVMASTADAVSSTAAPGATNWQPQPKPEPNPEPTVEPKTEPTPEAKPDATADAEAKADAKPESKDDTESDAEPKPEARADAPAETPAERPEQSERPQRPAAPTTAPVVAEGKPAGDAPNTDPVAAPERATPERDAVNGKPSTPEPTTRPVQPVQPTETVTAPDGPAIPESSPSTPADRDAPGGPNKD